MLLQVIQGYHGSLLYGTPLLSVWAADVKNSTKERWMKKGKDAQKEHREWDNHAEKYEVGTDLGLQRSEESIALRSSVHPVHVRCSSSQI